MDDPQEFAGLMVDEMIATLRAQVREGNPLSLFEQQCVLEQLVKERGRNGAHIKDQDHGRA